MAEFNLPFGVRVAGNDPIDKDRYIAVNLAARDSLVTVGRAHDGLQVYVESEKILYILKGNTNSDWRAKLELFSNEATEAEILALDPNLFLGQVWWATDEFCQYIPVSDASSTSGVGFWQKHCIEYNSKTNTFELPTDHSGVTLQLGEEIVINIINTDSVALDEVDPQVVLSFGATINQDFHSVARAKASDIPDGAIFGISTTNVDALIGKGKATVWGFVKSIDTTGTNVGEVWLTNDKLYVNGINGQLTRVRPNINIRPVVVVMKVDVATGMLFVNTISTKKEDESLIATSASRAYFQGDEETPNLTTFYKISSEGKGAVIDEQMAVVVADDSTEPYLQDFISGAFPADDIFFATARHAFMEYSHNSNGGSELLHIEMYIADGDGNPIDSGIGSQDYDYLNNGVQIVGDLGVKPVMVLHSPRMDGDSGDDFTASLTGFLGVDFPILAGQRIRFHILAEKFGTAGGSKTITIKFGDQRESWFEIFQNTTSSDVSNDSSVVGTNVTEALNNLLAASASLLKVEGFAAIQGQTSFTTAEDSLADDNQWSVIVNGQEWNSRTSNISFANGNISINHVTGVITFHIPLNVNDQVIIKYN